MKPSLLDFMGNRNAEAMQNHGREAVAGERPSQRDPRTASELDEGVTRRSLQPLRDVTGDELSDDGDGTAWRGSRRKHCLTG
jgi:hypothetical protein